MNTGTLVAGPLSKIGRTELAEIPVPQATATHRPVLITRLLRRWLKH